MKIKTVLVAGLAGGIGYVLGSKAGTSRYEEIKAKADQLAKSPQVQETVANLAEGVKKNAAKLPDPVADVVTSVADRAAGAAGGASGAAAGAAAGAESSPASSDLADPGLGDADEIDLATLEELTSPDVTTSVTETSTLSDTDPFVEPTLATDPFDAPGSPPRDL